ncbi:rod shape-determining protein [candidate division WOR-3 bacterium]|nr:rod shape-determining protein [candidate division WOR-3 bacterium]
MGFRFSFPGLISTDLAIDLGTANTLIYLPERGIVLNEPSVVAVDSNTNRSIAVGLEAKKMLGRTPEEITAIRPMKDGVIADFEMVEVMLRGFIDKVSMRKLFLRPRVVVAVPSGITAVEMRAVRDSVEHAGAREVFLIAEPVAAAIGVGLPVQTPTGNMIVDIGGGTTEIAVIALSGIVAKISIRVGGDEMDQAIANFIKKKYNLLIGDATAEEIKMNVGSAFPLDEEKDMEVRGIDLVSGIPKTIKVTSREIRSALEKPVSQIINAVKQALEKTPPELAADIVDKGIVMTGGGSLLRGLDKLLTEETNLLTKVAENPLECVARGAGYVLEDMAKFKALLMPGPTR